MLIEEITVWNKAENTIQEKFEQSMKFHRAYCISAQEEKTVRGSWNNICFVAKEN